MSLKLNNITAIEKQLNNTFTPEILTQHAKESKWIQRKSNRISPFDFVYLMCIEMISNPLAPLEGLCRRLFEMNQLCNIKPQSLNGRINTDKCVNFFKSIFIDVLKMNREKVSTLADSSLLAPFKRILTEDSTQIQLNAKLAEEFAGSGGSASTSSVKIDLIEDIKNTHIEAIEIYEGKKPDQSLSRRILDMLKPSDLVLRDLGYFKISVFEEIVLKGAFFLSRFLTSANVYLNPNTEEALNLADYLTQLKKQKYDVIELNVYLGSKHKLPVRLIAYRLPDSVVNERRRRAKAAAKKKGYALSDKHLALLAFSIYITNVDASVWSADVIGTIYRLRWSVELTFKRWKSLLHIDYLKGTRPERVRTLIYSRLTAIVLLNDFYMIAAHFMQSNHDRELSPHKFYQWLLQKERFAKAFLTNTFEELWELFTQLALSFCKQKRKRMTVLEMIQKEIGYLCSFKSNNKVLSSN